MRIMTVGHACIDVVHWLPGAMEPNTKWDSIDSRVQVGGSAANVASALRRLGCEAVLCAVLGSQRDPFTGMLLASLQHRGVDVDCVHVEAPCPNTIVAVSLDGENTLASHQPDEVTSAVHMPRSLEGIDMVLGDTYRLPLVRGVFAMAKAQGVPTMLDVDKPLPSYDDLPQADHVWFSQAAWQGIDESSRGMAMVRSHFGGSVGTTDGPNAVVWIDADGSIDSYMPPPIDPHSTLGAGDVFRAALAISLCLGHDLAMAVPMACASAGQHVSGRQLSRLVHQR